VEELYKLGAPKQKGGWVGTCLIQFLMVCAHRKSHIANRTSQIANRTSQIANRRSHIAHRTSHIANRTSTILDAQRASSSIA
jgi:hypothetical protein